MTVVVVALTIVFFIERALSRGQDWSFDSHGYHNVYAFATLFEGDRLGDQPLALGAYFNPLLDIALGWGVRTIDPRLVTAGLAMVQALALAGAALLPLRLQNGTIAAPSRPRSAVVEWIVVYCLGIALAYGAFAQIQLGATFGDLTSAFPAIAGVHLMVAWVQHDSKQHLTAGGACFGLAVALKYTNGPSLLGALAFVAVASLLRHGLGRALAITLFRFIAGVTAALAVAIGPWWIYLTIRFGNPLFPFGGRRLSDEFITDSGGFVDLGSNPFAIRSVGEFLGEPFRLIRPTTAVTEFPTSDPRLLFSFGACAVIATSWAVARRVLRSPSVPNDQLSAGTDRNPVRVAILGLAGLFVTYYCAWAFLFGNGRYLQLLELLAPAMLFSGVAVVIRSNDRSLGKPAIIAMVAVTAVSLPLTTSPELNHVPFGSSWYDFDVSGVPSLDDAMVVVPYEFEPLDFAIFLLEPAAFVRLNKALLDTRLADAERQRIREFSGPIYSFQGTDAGDQNLADVGLHRTEACQDVPAFQGFVYRLCELERAP